jgi:hypothetical protein
MGNLFVLSSTLVPNKSLVFLVRSYPRAPTLSSRLSVSESRPVRAHAARFSRASHLFPKFERRSVKADASVTMIIDYGKHSATATRTPSKRRNVRVCGLRRAKLLVVLCCGTDASCASIPVVHSDCLDWNSSSSED